MFDAAKRLRGWVYARGIEPIAFNRDVDEALAAERRAGADEERERIREALLPIYRSGHLPTHGETTRILDAEAER